MLNVSQLNTTYSCWNFYRSIKRKHRNRKGINSKI